jgi:hypothetical protein
LKIGRWAFSSLTTLVATSASAAFAMVFALMLGVAFGRRGLINPRRQHFQVD